MPKIFISHAVKDHKLVVQPFIDLLVMGLKVDRDEIYYTSGGDIPTGVNFPEHIKDNINSSQLVILILTDNYMDSHFCLNEMGAAWANNQSIYPIIIPPSSYNLLDRSALRGVTNFLMVNDANDLAKLRDEMALKKLTGNNIRSAEYNVRCETFIKALNKYRKQRLKEGPLTVPVADHKQLMNDLKEYKVELQEKIIESDAKDALIEQLRKLKDQTAVKQVMQAHNTNEWDELQEIIEESRSALDELNPMMVSLVYHYRTFSQNFVPESYSWSEIHALAASRFIFRDENDITINDDHPTVKAVMRHLNSLDEAIEGMSPEVSERFEEEYNLQPELSNIDFWTKIFRIRGMVLSN